MHRIGLGSLWACVLVATFHGISQAQAPAAPASAAARQADSLAPLKDAATEDQIREYLRVSGELDSFKESWIAAVEKNRSKGAPYWPEEFWKTLKDEMQKTDMTPMYVTFLQHVVTREQMEEVLNAYHRLGKEHFQGSPECFMLGNAVEKSRPEFDNMKLAKTQELFSRVYVAYKPQIKAARTRYLSEHPDYVDR